MHYWRLFTRQHCLLRETLKNGFNSYHLELMGTKMFSSTVPTLKQKGFITLLWNTILSWEGMWLIINKYHIEEKNLFGIIAGIFSRNSFYETFFPIRISNYFNCSFLFVITKGLSPAEWNVFSVSNEIDTRINKNIGENGYKMTRLKNNMQALI